MRGIAAMVGFAEPRVASGDLHPFDAPAPRAAHNALALLRDSRVEAVYRKQRLPNYAVFDEQRYFEPGTEPLVVELAGTQVGLTICEDVWETRAAGERRGGPGRGADRLPFPGLRYYRGKRADREAMFASRARDYGAASAFCNLVGGQDELVFDGASFVVGAGGELVARWSSPKSFWLVDLGGNGGPVAEPLFDLEEVYGALVLGLRDYVSRTGSTACSSRSPVESIRRWSRRLRRMPSAATGSPASSCCRRTRAPRRRPMPARSSATSARGPGRDPDQPAMGAYDVALDGSIEGGATGLTAENLQARIRGNLMMALSNAHGWLVLTTGNKSEMSVRLRDALRRHGRWLRRDQGRSEDARL